MNLVKSNQRYVLAAAVVFVVGGCKGDDPPPTKVEKSPTPVRPGAAADPHAGPDHASHGEQGTGGGLVAHGKQITAANDWCGGHGVPESKCTICNPQLIAKFKAAGDYCAGHNLPESVCPKCNPSGAAAAKAAYEKARDAAKGGKDPHAEAGGHGTGDWCTGHGVPESKCPKCNPGLEAKFRAAGDWCVTHGYPASACPVCNPQTPPKGNKPPELFKPGTLVRFHSAAIERAAGIETTAAVAISLGSHIRCTARIDYNRNRFAEIRSPIPSLVERVGVDLGATVAKGDKLFTLSSAQIGVLKSRRYAAGSKLSISKANLKRQRALKKAGGASARDVELARLQVSEATSTLVSISRSLRVSGISSRGHRGAFDLLAPIAGRVVRRPAVIGAQADPSTSLATVADTRTMWATLELNEWDAALVRVGQPVSLRVDGAAGQLFRGKITWLASAVDLKTRMVHARAEIANPKGALRAHQFARATVAVSAPKKSVAVPAHAVQQVGSGHVVFVRLKVGLYEPRAVILGRSDGRLVHVAGRLMVGDPVVTTGAFLLRTEIQKDSIGAGCCETDRPGGGH